MDTVARDQVGQVQEHSILGGLLLTYGKYGLLVLGAWLSDNGYVSHGAYTKWSPLVITLVMVAVHSWWKQLNQKYKDMARSILPTDATMQDIQTLANEINPVVPQALSNTTTLITKEGKVDVVQHDVVTPQA